MEAHSSFAVSEDFAVLVTAIISASPALIEMFSSPEIDARGMVNFKFSFEADDEEHRDAFAECVAESITFLATM